GSADGSYTPAASGTYTVKTRCSAVPGCADSDTQDVVVVSSPVAALAPLGSVCAGTAITLDGSASDPGSCPTALEYQFSSGATVLQPWGPAASFGPFTPSSSGSYQVEARCPAAP